ncbi:MAG: VanZ family protein [Pseudomonadota bacterium]
MPTEAQRALRQAWQPALRAASCFSAAGLLVAGVLVGGATPAAVGLIDAPWDKLVHVLTYATLCLLLAGGFNGRRPLLAASLAFAIGVTDEAMQSFYPGRHADLADLGADLAGALLATALLRLLWGRRD